MCAIGGILKLDKRKTFDVETQLDVISLLMEMEKRGSQSWGAYLEKHKELPHLNCGLVDETIPGEIFKMPGKFTDFINEKDGVIYLDGTHTILLHTRQATSGSSEENRNNHPFNTENFVLAHNGIISNHAELKTKFNIQTDIECDSYMIVYLIQHFYDEGKTVKDAIIAATQEIDGGYACWLYHKDKKDLYLFRNSKNPIEYYIDEERGIFIFASEDGYIVNTYGDDKLTTTDIKTLPYNVVYKLQSNELVKLADFESKPVVWSGYNNTCNTSVTTWTSVDKFDRLMARFYLFLAKFDAVTYQHILAATQSSSFLLVRKTCKPLIDLLDANGFELYKREITNMEWVRYVTSRTNMENLVTGFLQVVTPEVKCNKLVEVKHAIQYEDRELLLALQEFSSDTNIDFSFINSTYIFKLNTKTPEYVRTLFKDCGAYKISRRNNTLRLKATTYHKSHLSELVNNYLDRSAYWGE